MPSIRKSSSSSPKRARRGEVAWRALVAAWETSGLSQAAFARRRGVSAQGLNYWRRRVGHHQAVRPAKDPGFVEIPPVTPSGGGGVVIEAGNGIRVHVARGFDPLVLRAVVTALSGPVPGC